MQELLPRVESGTETENNACPWMDGSRVMHTAMDGE